MKVYQKLLTLSRGKQIAIAVCFIHFFAVLGLCTHHLLSRRIKPPRPMIVKTIAAMPPQTSPQRGTRQIEAKSSAPKSKAAPVPKKTKTESAAFKNPAPKSKPVTQKTPPPKEEKLFKEIADSLEVLSSEAKRSRTALTLPSKIQPKAQIAPQTEIAPTYGEFLIAYLQNVLDLPEYGEVKAKIEIDRFGKLIDCEILEAKSAKNADFLKNQLPSLSFPCLNEFGIIDTTETFTITFRNVEIH